MPSIFLRLGIVKKVNKFVLEMENYYDVERTKVDDKVIIVVIFLCAWVVN